jgi:hypothetical protein
MAEGDLLFFFNLVIGDRDEGHERREFWLPYVKHVVDSNVALSYEDRARVGSQMTQKLTFSQASGGQHTSAFLMRFRGTSDFIAIEFSRIGNALYVYDTAAFLSRGRDIRTATFVVETDLKNRAEAIAVFRHNGNWRWKVRAFLSRHGIRPV